MQNLHAKLAKKIGPTKNTPNKSTIKYVGDTTTKELGELSKKELQGITK